MINRLNYLSISAEIVIICLKTNRSDQVNWSDQETCF